MPTLSTVAGRRPGRPEVRRAISGMPCTGCCSTPVPVRTVPGSACLRSCLAGHSKGTPRIHPGSSGRARVERSAPRQLDRANKQLGLAWRRALRPLPAPSSREVAQGRQPLPHPGVAEAMTASPAPGKD